MEASKGLPENWTWKGLEGAWSSVSPYPLLQALYFWASPALPNLEGKTGMLPGGGYGGRDGGGQQ